jgi:hypothetical protein
MYARFTFQRSLRNPYSFHSLHNIASFVFNHSRTLPFLGYHATLSSHVACALLSKNTGGTPIRIPFPKLKRAQSSLLINFQLLTFNFELPSTFNFQPPPLTPIIPPLTQLPSISPFPATLTKKTGEWVVYSVNRNHRGSSHRGFTAHESRFTTHDSPRLRYCGDAHSLHLGELNTCGSC